MTSEAATEWLRRDAKSFWTTTTLLRLIH